MEKLSRTRALCPGASLWILPLAELSRSNFESNWRLSLDILFAVHPVGIRRNPPRSLGRRLDQTAVVFDEYLLLQANRL